MIIQVNLLAYLQKILAFKKLSVYKNRQPSDILESWRSINDITFELPNPMAFNLPGILDSIEMHCQECK